MDKQPKNIQQIEITQRERQSMKVIRSYAEPNKAVNVKNLIQQLVNIELEKVVNTMSVNSPASHGKITLGGDCA
jgi:hypothetical protein